MPRAAGGAGGPGMDVGLQVRDLVPWHRGDTRLVTKPNERTDPDKAFLMLRGKRRLVTRSSGKTRAIYRVVTRWR